MVLMSAPIFRTLSPDEVVVFSAEAALEAGAAGAPVLPALEAAELLPLPQAAMENTIEAASSIANNFFFIWVIPSISFCNKWKESEKVVILAKISWNLSDFLL